MTREDRADEAPKRRPVLDALINLDDEIGRILTSTKALEERLNPALAPATTETQSRPQEKLAAGSDLAHRIRSLNDVALDINALLQTLQVRLEI